MTTDEELTEALELCGFGTNERQESRLINILGVILRLQDVPSLPVTFAEIYDQLQKDEPDIKLTKAWVHRVIKSLVDMKLIRVDNPVSHRKKYIADVNTVMTGFELKKSETIEELEVKRKAINDEHAKLDNLDCGNLSKEFVRNVTGREEELSSRIVRGVKELHRVLRYNMLDIAGEGDIIRATLLWVGSFLDDSTRERTMRFIEAAERGAEIRYLVSSDVFQVEENTNKIASLEGLKGLSKFITDARKRGKKFDVRVYSGPKTYHQVSINEESMALIIADNPIIATWITRKFNPDLIDNAVKTFDKDWNRAKSVIDLSLKDVASFGEPPEEPIRELMPTEIEGE